VYSNARTLRTSLQLTRRFLGVFEGTPSTNQYTAQGDTRPDVCGHPAMIDAVG